jgi:DNA helicase HerA-like ATPase
MSVGRVLGTQDAMPLEFWVAIEPGEYLELDDVVVVRTELPDGQVVTLHGVVDLVKARHEGVLFDSDVFLVEDAVLPAGTSRTAHVSVTRLEPEIYVPPLPGRPVERAVGPDRERALFFDGMVRRFPLGLGRDGQVIYGNLEFLDGTRGRTSTSQASRGSHEDDLCDVPVAQRVSVRGLGIAGANAHALVFNVKGEDLLFLDQPNAGLKPEDVARYEKLGLPATPFQSVQLLAPVRRGSDLAIPDTGSRQAGVTAYYWSLLEFCRDRYLRFQFADADDETSQLGFLVQRVAQLAASARPDPLTPGASRSAEPTRRRAPRSWAGHHEPSRCVGGAAAPGTKSAFLRRLEAGLARVGHLVRRANEEEAARHRIDWAARQVSVIDIHNLHDQAKRFVVGVVLKRMFEDKESRGTAQPLVFTVLDELNRYAPRSGWSPIKEVLLDIAERGRSLGIILIGAQQTSSEVELRVIANAAFRVVGRLDAAEAEKNEYRFLPTASRARAGILKPGTLIVHQPEIPVPLLLQFPYPAWATRVSEVRASEADPFRGF